MEVCAEVKRMKRVSKRQWSNPSTDSPHSAPFHLTKPLKDYYIVQTLGLSFIYDFFGTYKGKKAH